MKALVGAFNQEKALVGAFSVIVQAVVEPMDCFTALVKTVSAGPSPAYSPRPAAASCRPEFVFIFLPLMCPDFIVDYFKAGEIQS